MQSDADKESTADQSSKASVTEDDHSLEENKQLVSPILSESVLSVHVPPVEYMLGIADLTGEMMRMAISSVGQGNLDLPFQLCEFLRLVLDAFVSYGNVSRELNRKLWTLKQSVQKVENACYTLQVRGSEIPKHMLADMLSNKPPSKNYTEDDFTPVEE